MNAKLDSHLKWPAERFYWAVFDASILRGRRRGSEQLGFLFEPCVPQSLDELHVVYESLGEGRYLACAVERAELAQLEANIETLTPQALPPFVVDEIEPSRLNFLTGQFTPPAVRRLERRWSQAAVLIVLLWVLTVTVGLGRRAAAVERQEELVSAQENEVYRVVLGQPTGVLPLPLQLEAKLRSLRQTRTPALQVPRPFDAALVLSELLGRWPDGLAVETDSIHITPDSIHVQCTLKSTAEVQKLASAVGELPGWRLLQPTIRSRVDSVRATVQLKREETNR